MNIVIDSNIIFSALIRDSATRKLILEYVGVEVYEDGRIIIKKVNY